MSTPTERDRLGRAYGALCEAQAGLILLREAIGMGGRPKPEVWGKVEQHIAEARLEIDRARNTFRPPSAGGASAPHADSGGLVPDPATPASESP